jgi:hypothetical protein
MRKAGALKVISKGTPITELYGALQEAVAAVRPILVIEEPSVEETSVNELEAKPETPHPNDSLFRTK